MRLVEIGWNTLTVKKKKINEKLYSRIRLGNGVFFFKDIYAVSRCHVAVEWLGRELVGECRLAMGFAFLSSEWRNQGLLLVGGFLFGIYGRKREKGDKNRRKKKF